MNHYYLPHSVDDALARLSSGDWRILAGGTDFYPAQGHKPLREKVLDISGLDSLRGISQSQDDWRLGALTTWTELADAALPPGFSGLQQAAKQVGAQQIQNLGTLVGNLCNASPAADGMPPLLTLEARVELSSAEGVRSLPLADFITGYRRTARLPHELVTAILIPQTRGQGKSFFLKLGQRSYLSISTVMVSVLLVPSDDGRIALARIAVGACSEVATRLTALEQALEGQEMSAALADWVEPQHLSALSPIDDVRATAAYRIQAADELVRRALTICGGGERG